MSLFDHARKLDRLGDPAARQAYADVLMRDPAHRDALAALGALLADTGYTSAARTVFEQAITVYPDDLAARVKLANLLRLAGDLDEARAHYDAALIVAPDCPEAHQGLSYLLDETDEPAAAHHRARGFSNRWHTVSAYRGNGPPVTVLQLVSARGGNIPTARILDDRIFLTHTLVCDYADRIAPLPPHDVVVSAIADAERCEEALTVAAHLLAATQRSVINPPDRVGLTSRTTTLRRLSELPGIVAPRCDLLPRGAFADGPPAGFAVPFLVRSTGCHTGRHFVRVDHAGDVRRAVAALPGERLIALQYLDATGPDGSSRKYRVMLIGGKILPLHLAISPNWKVHHFSAGMASNALHRAEEAAFLSDAKAVLGPVAMDALAGIAAALKLDHCGVDFAVAANGSLLLFEANAAMTIAQPPLDPIWDYRRDAAARALVAAQDLIRDRAARPGPAASPRTPPE